MILLIRNVVHTQKNKKKNKGDTKNRSLIFHVRLRIIQNNAENPNEREAHSQNLSFPISPKNPKSHQDKGWFHKATEKKMIK